MLGGRRPPPTAAAAPQYQCQTFLSRADAHKFPALGAPNASLRADALSHDRRRFPDPLESKSRCAPRTLRNITTSVRPRQQLVRLHATDTICCGEKCITFGKRPAALTASDESAAAPQGENLASPSRIALSRWTGPLRVAIVRREKLLGRLTETR